MHLFDTVLVTASSERQADAFRALLERRRAHGLYPRELAFEVVPDPPGGRVGTGGSTLWALARLVESRGAAADPAAFFARERILLIHAGGESRRLPCYAPEGKLFAPLPLPSSALLPPVVLDAQLGLFFDYPWRRGEIVVSSGDVVIEFDTGSVPEERGAVFGFAKPAAVEQGARHGVFRFDPHREHVVDYLQKAPADVLARTALIEGTGECALDIGLVSLAPSAALAFLALGRSPLAGGTLLDAVARGSVRFDLYLEVLTACLRGLSREAFWERVRGASALPCELAERVYDAFHPFGLGGMVTRSTVFEHVGSLAELPEASRSLLAQGIKPFYEPDVGEIRPIEAPDRIVHDCAAVDLRVTGASPVLVEGCSSCRLVLEGDNVVVGLDGLSLPFTLPRGFVLDGRELPEGRVVVVLSSRDSLKAETDVSRLVFCGRPLDTWLAERGLSRDDVFSPGDPPDLFAARLFCLDPTPERAARVRGAAGRVVDGGLPRGAPPVARRDPGPGRSRAPRGAARGAAARRVARALPRRAGLARRRLSPTSPRRSPARSGASPSRRGSTAPTTRCCAPTASGSSARRFPARAPPPASPRSTTCPAPATGRRCGRRSRRTRSSGRARPSASTSPAAGPTRRPTPCATAAAW